MREGVRALRSLPPLHVVDCCLDRSVRSIGRWALSGFWEKPSDEHEAGHDQCRFEHLLFSSRGPAASKRRFCSELTTPRQGISARFPAASRATQRRIAFRFLAASRNDWMSRALEGGSRVDSISSLRRSRFRRRCPQLRQRRRCRHPSEARHPEPTRPRVR
jgi:hypothetical protein